MIPKFPEEETLKNFRSKLTEEGLSPMEWRKYISLIKKKRAWRISQEKHGS